MFCCLQANLKADWINKPLHQRCHELSKIIDDYPAKVWFSDLLHARILKVFTLLVHLWLTLLFTLSWYTLQPLRPYKVLIFAPTQLFIRFIREICIGAEQLFSVARVLEIKRSVICLAHGSRPTAVLLAPFAPHPDSTQCCLNEWCLFSTELCDLVSQIHLTVCTSHTCLFLVG